MRPSRVAKAQEWEIFFFFETPGTYTIVEGCGNFIYPVGDSR